MFPEHDHPLPECVSVPGADGARHFPAHAAIMSGCPECRGGRGRDGFGFIRCRPTQRDGKVLKRVAANPLSPWQPDT